MTLRECPPEDHFVGVVDEGTTATTLNFATAQDLQIGAVVGVEVGDDTVLFQVTHARIDRRDVRGGSQLIERATATQLGIFDPASGRLTQHRWVVPPGQMVRVVHELPEQPGALGPGLQRIGTVLYTEIPVYLDLALLCEGHAAVLGMTKMGKSTLTRRIASAIADTRGTVVMDGTGEYSTKHGLVAFDEQSPWTDTSLSVLEPGDGAVRADFALKWVEKLFEVAGAEYAAGDPTPRAVIFEEAHDFFPEPASLGFNAPGRDSSYTLGLRMMQIRKFGVSFVLVSQRTAVVSKSALSQCENLIVFRSVDRTGLDYLEDLSGADVRRLIPTLRQGEAVVFGPAVSADGPVAIKVDPPLHPGEIDHAPA